MRKNNVTVSKVEFGQGRDPKVGSAPFVNLEEGVCFTQARNVVSDRIYATTLGEKAYKKFLKAQRS